MQEMELYVLLCDDEQTTSAPVPSAYSEADGRLMATVANKHL